MNYFWNTISLETPVFCFHYWDYLKNFWRNKKDSANEKKSEKMKYWFKNWYNNSAFIFSDFLLIGYLKLRFVSSTFWTKISKNSYCRPWFGRFTFIASESQISESTFLQSLTFSCVVDIRYSAEFSKFRLHKITGTISRDTIAENFDFSSHDAVFFLYLSENHSCKNHVFWGQKI